MSTKGGKQGTRGSGRDPNAGRKISKNQINTSGRRSVAAGKKKKYDVICEKEFRASEQNTKLKQMQLLEKKGLCEAKLVEKRLARQAALEMDQEYANMQGSEEQEQEYTNIQGGGEQDQEKRVDETAMLVTSISDEDSDDDSDDASEEESISQQLTGVKLAEVSSPSPLSVPVPPSTEEETLKSSADNATIFRMTTAPLPLQAQAQGGEEDNIDTNTDFTSEKIIADMAEIDIEDSDEEEIVVTQQDSAKPSSTHTARLTQREIRHFVKEYFNTFPNRVVSHVKNHDGVNIYKNKLSMTKSKRREVLPKEVEANEKLLAQLPYIEDIATYKFFFVQ